MALRHMKWILRHHYQRELPTIATTCMIDNLVAMMSIVLEDMPTPRPQQE